LRGTSSRLRGTSSRLRVEIHACCCVGRLADCVGRLADCMCCLADMRSDCMAYRRVHSLTGSAVNGRPPLKELDGGHFAVAVQAGHKLCLTLNSATTTLKVLAGGHCAVAVHCTAVDLVGGAALCTGAPSGVRFLLPPPPPPPPLRTDKTVFALLSRNGVGARVL
jgi:hypothetical protein